MRRFSQKQSLTTLSEINITPLLDLAFVLLIIFLITTPLMENSIDVVVPTGVASKNAVDPALVQTISITRDGNLKLNTEPIGLDQLETRLKDLKNAKSELAVVIRSHKELPVQKLVDVMDALQLLQITKIGVVTKSEPD